MLIVGIVVVEAIGCDLCGGVVVVDPIMCTVGRRVVVGLVVVVLAVRFAMPVATKTTIHCEFCAQEHVLR